MSLSMITVSGLELESLLVLCLELLFFKILLYVNKNWRYIDCLRITIRLLETLHFDLKYVRVYRHPITLYCFNSVNLDALRITSVNLSFVDL
jgi:hypothetical protein